MHVFDQVAIKNAAGQDVISTAEYLKLPLRERVKMIASGQTQFLCDGQVIAMRDAVASMNRAA